jgi:hypothetical protein
MVERISREVLCTDMQRVGNETGDRPTEDAYRERGEYSAQTVYDRFGSWNAALEAAGIERERPPPRPKQDCARSYAHSPSAWMARRQPRT